MKDSPSRNRTYILVGTFVAKYRGKKTDDPHGLKVSDFRIHPYETSITDAYIIDASFLSCIVDQNNYQDLPLSCPLEIYPRNSDQAYRISSSTLKIYHPRISNVSQQGVEVYGTLSGITALHLKEEKLEFNPISIPSFEIEETFPGFREPPVSTITSTTTKQKRKPIDFAGIFEALFLLFSVLLVFVFAYSIFSIFHPFILLALAGIAVFALIVNSIPSWIANPVFDVLKKLATFIFYAGGVLLFLGLGIILLGNLVAYFFFWIPLVAIFFLIDYLTRFSWLVFRNASILAIVVLALSIPVLLAEFNGSTSSPIRTYDPVPRTVEIPSTKNAEVVTKPVDTVSRKIYHTISWWDFDNIRHKITYDINQADYQASQLKRESVNIPVQSNKDFGILFYRLLEGERLQVESFTVQLDSIRQSRNLNEIEFAHLIVSLVQQIDYSLLNEDACPTATPLPCQDKVKYGVYTPTEFLYSLKGDCDTKSLLLYLLFDEFDYDVTLLGSLQYQHAMIALNVPGKGVAVNIQNKPYYVWEITSPGWELGTIPPENNLLQFWETILINGQNQLQ